MRLYLSITPVEEILYNFAGDETGTVYAVLGVLRFTHASMVLWRKTVYRSWWDWLPWRRSYDERCAAAMGECSGMLRKLIADYAV